MTLPMRCAAVLMCVLPLLAGCRSSVSTTGSDELALEALFDSALCSVEGQQWLHVLLLSGPEDDPDAALHIQMFYRPEAGRTPMDVHATNATVHYVRFQDGAAGVYGGAGLMMPGWRFSGSTFNAELRHANLRLLDASPGFTGQLTRPWIAGSLSARRDDRRTMELLRQIQGKLAERLGYPRFVMAE